MHVDVTRVLFYADASRDIRPRTASDSHPKGARGVDTRTVAHAHSPALATGFRMLYSIVNSVRIALGCG